METLTVRPSVPRIIFFIVAFGVVGCAGAGIIEHFGGQIDPGGRVTSWLVLIASVGVPIIILSLSPILFYFRLRPTGLQVCFFRRLPVLNWRAIERIGRWDERLYVARREYLAFVFTPRAKEIATNLTPIITRTRLKTGGLYDLMLPVSFGMDTDKLVALLNEWRVRYST